jgi:hypothetical protein
MSRLIDDLNALLQKHRRRGEMDSGLEDERLWEVAALKTVARRGNSRGWPRVKADEKVPPGPHSDWTHTWRRGAEVEIGAMIALLYLGGNAP